MRGKLFFIAVFVCINLQAFSSLKVTDLLTEYHKNPIGIEKTPRLFWKIQSDKNNTCQLKYEIRCAESVDKLKLKKEILWNSGKVRSENSTHVKYEGRKLRSGQRIYWKVRIWDNHGRRSEWSEPAFFEMGLLNKSDWKAKWIQCNNLYTEELRTGRSPYLHKKFNLKKNIKSARVYITSLGLYELYINGTVVSSHNFNPGYTSYKKRLQYQVFDITSKLKSGRNAIGTILGDGWYNGFRENRTKKRSLLCQLNITYEDGSSETIVSDSSWKSGLGAIDYSGIYFGELYDATKEPECFATEGFDDSKWLNCEIMSNKHTWYAWGKNEKGKLVPSIGCNVKRFENFNPVSIKKIASDRYILDFGQNITGWVKIKTNGEGRRFHRITIKHAEELNSNGVLYIESLRSASQKIEYTLAGRKHEEYEPHFTFQGFRYAEVRGLGHKPNPDEFTAVAVYSDMPETGMFECSEPMLNKLYKNTMWGQKGNFVDVPTDCPQRDERLGWTGDVQVFVPTACFNMFAPAFYTKWLEDLKVDQYENGEVPATIPDAIGVGGRAGWADAAVVVPWTLYNYYGDTEILANQYESMKKHVDYYAKQAGDNFKMPNKGQFADWLHNPKSTTDKQLIADAYFAYSANILSKIASVLNRDKDAKTYKTLFENVKKAFNKSYVKQNGEMSSYTQTAYSMALEFDLLPDDLRPKVAKLLANNVEKFGHITTGFLGTPLVSFALSNNGYSEQAYKLIHRKEFPSWLYPITKGATTIWERWDGIKPDGSFQNPDMNSFNHYAYGAIVNWMYRTIGGIKPSDESCGFKSFVIQLQPDNKITWANTSYNSIYGLIKSEWKKKGNIMNLYVEIPVNTSSIVMIPHNAKNILVDGKRYKRFEIAKSGDKFIKLNSGKYQVIYEI